MCSLPVLDDRGHVRLSVATEEICGKIDDNRLGMLGFSLGECRDFVRTFLVHYFVGGAVDDTQDVDVLLQERGYERAVVVKGAELWMSQNVERYLVTYGLGCGGPYCEDNYAGWQTVLQTAEMVDKLYTDWLCGEYYDERLKLLKEVLAYPTETWGVSAQSLLPIDDCLAVVIGIADALADAEPVATDDGSSVMIVNNSSWTLQSIWLMYGTEVVDHMIAWGVSCFLEPHEEFAGRVWSNNPMKDVLHDDDCGIWGDELTDLTLWDDN